MTKHTCDVHVTITNTDPYTANRAALSLVDWINAEFPGYQVSTDAREWNEAEQRIHEQESAARDADRLNPSQARFLAAQLTGWADRVEEGS